MKIQVKVATSQADALLIIEGNTLSDCFEQLPMRAAERGLGLVNDGTWVTYSVRVLA